MSDVRYTGAHLVFEGGALSLDFRKSRGHFAFTDDQLEPVREYDEDHVWDGYLVKLPGSELEAIRDFLNQWLPPAESGAGSPSEASASAPATDEPRPPAERWVCAECDFVGVEADANQDRDWCGNCCADFPATADLCPGCRDDSLCSACPKCAGSYYADPFGDEATETLIPPEFVVAPREATRFADLWSVLEMCEAGKGHNPGMISIATSRFRELLSLAALPPPGGGKGAFRPDAASVIPVLAHLVATGQATDQQRAELLAALGAPQTQSEGGK